MPGQIINSPCVSLGEAVESVGAGRGEDDPFPMVSMRALRAFAKASISGDGGSPSF